jgi:SAM-dependent methyltransferase
MLDLLRRMGVHAPARVLDAGCGWGVNLDVLERRGYRVTGLDISKQILERLDRPNRELVEADLTQALPSTVNRFQAVIALDVIEHVDDDRGVVAGLARLTEPGGVVIVSVPALPDLYTEFDSVQGHRRRYLPETLRRAFEQTDLRIERMHWWGSWMVPLLRRQRGRPRTEEAEEKTPAEIYKHYLKPPPWPFSWALRLAFAVEKVRTLRGTPAQGTSLFAVARRL